MPYLVRKPYAPSPTLAKGNVFNPKDDKFETLGHRMLKALENGSDLGVTTPVTYDDDSATQVDVLSSPDHDFFDIAEEFGVETERIENIPSSTEGVESQK